MIDETGARRQESLREAPAQAGLREMPYPVRGIVRSVHYHDSENNPTGQTVVDIDLLGGYPTITKVPLCTGKINKATGEEWTPDPGDGVIVQFIYGHWNDPIVTGYFRLPENEIQADLSDAPFGMRRYHMRCNETDVVIDKDGNRITYIAGNQNEEVEGDDTLIVHGNVNIHVYGTATVTVDGNTTVTTPNATVHASGQVTLDTPLTACTGNLQVAGGITSTGTYGSSGGKITTPGDIQTTGGNVIDQVRSIAADRTIYNSHNHSGNGTSVPSPQM